MVIPENLLLHKRKALHVEYTISTYVYIKWLMTYIKVYGLTRPIFVSSIKVHAFTYILWSGVRPINFRLEYQGHILFCCTTQDKPHSFSQLRINHIHFHKVST